jgi:hypothetical protein
MFIFPVRSLTSDLNLRYFPSLGGSKNDTEYLSLIHSWNQPNRVHLDKDSCSFLIYDCHIITVTLRGTAGKSLEKRNFLNFESERALTEVWIQPTIVFKLR